MTTTWEEIKAARLTTAGAREGYALANAAYEFGRRVRTRREELGMSQSELASAMGSSQSAIARLEAGGTQPTLKTMHALSRALRASWIIAPDGIQTAEATGGDTKQLSNPRARPA